MTTADYLIDSALVLLVLLQIKERPLTTKLLISPLVIVAIAVVNYLHGIPTARNDLVLVGLLALTGLSIGVASGQTVFMRRDRDGEVLARAGWLSGFFWVLGMGSRLAFLVWISHGPVQRPPRDHEPRGLDSRPPGHGGVRGVGPVPRPGRPPSPGRAGSPRSRAHLSDTPVGNERDPPGSGCRFVVAGRTLSELNLLSLCP